MGWTERAVGIAATVTLLVGCAPSALLTYRPQQPPTVTLPIELAGVRDRRAEFGTMFAVELAATGDRGPVAWLHAVPEAPASPGAGLHDARFAQRAHGTVVLVVAGMFGDCLGEHAVPFGDGAALPPGRALEEGFRQYDDLGLRAVRYVQVPGRASADANGRLLATEIRAIAAERGVERIVLVGYSKGVTDLLHALVQMQRDGGVPRAVVALVSVAGVVLGTPLADYYESLYDAVSPHVDPLRCTPSQGGDLASLTRRERIAWLSANPLPPGLAYYSIVAHTAVDNMAPLLRVPARQLMATDPRNDGQVIAADAILPGSALLAEADADHWDVALPRDRHPNALLRAMTSGREFPRAALFRATVKWSVARSP